MEILVTGGAGYIGSYACKLLEAEGYRPVILDNLSRGHRKAARHGVFYQGNVSDRRLLQKIFSSHDIAAVMHFAAFAYVGESVSDPGLYYENNASEALVLLREMVENGIDRFIFSSTCAVYGEPVELPLRENHPRSPVSPYGRSKRMVEEFLSDFQQAYDLQYTALRYFNAAGADPEGVLGEDHRPETHLIPLVLQTALGQRKEITIFGEDYPTEDGACIRDYIHIHDLADAHIRALEKLIETGQSEKYNLGNGTGHSVLQVIEAAEAITGCSIPRKIAGRRAGDPAVLVASCEKAVRELGWRPRYADIETIIETAWRWLRDHPRGYQ